MSAALALDHVRVAGDVIHVGHRYVGLRIRGRLRLLEARDVAGVEAAGVVVSAALAAELELDEAAAGLTDADLARRFSKSVDWIYRNIATLVAEEGFPAPVTTLGHRRYAPAAVDRWFGRPRDAARDQAARMAAEQAATEAAARRRPPRAFSEPLEHGEAAEIEADAWRAAIADEYGSEGR